MAKVITERERLLRLRNAELKDISSRDSLTGIANRGAFDRYLSEVWAAAAASENPLSLLFVDIDYFKRYNDTYGHQAGDLALRVIAHALQHLGLRDSDMIARYGGEEFVILLPNTSLAGAVTVAERAVAAIRNLDMPHDASPKRRISISIGASSCYPSNDNHPDSLIASADAALYHAKAAGRDQVYAEILSSTQNKTPEQEFNSTAMVNTQD
jgi:diguanylate cyclase (GGDEF)-like protein